MNTTDTTEINGAAVTLPLSIPPAKARQHRECEEAVAAYVANGGVVTVGEPARSKAPPKRPLGALAQALLDKATKAAPLATPAAKEDHDPLTTDQNRADDDGMPVKDDDLDIPPALRRPLTPEALARAEKLIADETERTVKSPKTRTITNPKPKATKPEPKAKTPKPEPKAPRAAAPKPKKTAAAAEGDTKPKAPRKPVGNLRPDGLVAGSAMAILVDAVLRPGGATNEELCKAVGWAQCLPCLRKACARAGVTLSTEKQKGQLTRYIGTRG